MEAILERLAQGFIGLGGLGGLALLIRALSNRGTPIIAAAESVTVIQERTIERLNREKDDLEQAKALVERDRDHFRMLARYYRGRYGDPTDPYLRRIIIDETGGGGAGG